MNSLVLYEEMMTLLSEVEATVNNLPLTFVYNVFTEPRLTPNHLTYGRTLDFSVIDKGTEPIDIDIEGVVIPVVV